MPVSLEIGVATELAVDDDGDVTAVFEELHDFRALAGEIGPTGLGVGILLQSANVAALEAEVDLLEVFLVGAANREGVAAERDDARILDEGLLEDALQGDSKSRAFMVRISTKRV